MAFFLDYDVVLNILAGMDRTINDINAALEEFAIATTRYNVTMSDNTAREATAMVNEMRSHLIQIKERIENSSKRVYAGASGMKNIEERVRDGGLRQ